MKAETIKLTDKENKFVVEYLIDLNATKAAIRTGYSRKTAGQIGHALLKKVKIRKALNAAIEEAFDISGTELKYQVINQLKLCAFGKKISNHDKIKALEILGKYLKLFSDSSPVTVNNFPISKELISEGQ